MLGDIGPKERALYAYLRGKFSDDNLWADAANAIQSLVARALKAEFWREHHFSERNFTSEVFCAKCESGPSDPRHNYDDSAWQDAAGRVLTGP